MHNQLFDLLCDRPASVLAIVGMTKNVGKTVTLNYLIDCYARSGSTPGLVSAGYDGERFDRLTLKDKPRIHAPAGAIVATAGACLNTADAVLEPLHKSCVSTPLGEVWVARVREPGLVELAGPGSVSGLKLMIARMKEMGGGPILIDGAINRLASASPAVSDGVILASGAAVAPVMEDVIQKTCFRCTLLELPALEDRAMELKAREAVESAEAALLHREGDGWELELLSAPIPLMAGAALKDRCRQGGEAVVLGGALVDNILLDMLALPFPPLLILRDATKIFASPEPYTRYLKRGGKIRALDPVSLLAVTLNPTDPLGKGYPPREFLEQMAGALAPRPVFDLVLDSF